MKKPEIRQGDVHFVVNAKSRKIKCYDSNGKMKWMTEARCEATNGGYQNFQGNTPPGLYKCGAPDDVLSSESDRNSYGPWFVPLEEQEGQMSRYGRAGIGVHGGGSGLANPYYSPKQGWVVTHGCIRVQNDDLNRFVKTVFHTRRSGRNAWLSVHW